MDLFNILQFVIFNLLIIGVYCEPQCCPNNGTMLTSKICKDGTAVQIKCDEYPLTLNKDWGAFSQYYTSSDKEGDYLDAYVTGYVIRTPYFCVGPISYSTNKTSIVAVTCSSFRTWYNDQNITANEKTKSELSIYKITTLVLNCLSCLTLLGTAAIYYFLPETQDLQGTCYFHFTLLAGLGHGIFSYILIFNTRGILPNFCITNAYVLMYLALSVFMWVLVISYNTWRQACNRVNEDDGKLLKKYKLSVYGTPALLGFFCWAHVHWNNFGEEDDFFVLDCYKHEYRLYQYYALFPIFIIFFLNFVLFVDCQRRIWNQHSIQVRDRKLMIKILKYRFFLNSKLFFIMGIPWNLLIFHLVIQNYFGLGPWILTVLISICIVGEGIPIFVILIFSRKLVLRSITNRWLKTHTYIPENWRTSKDSETEEEVEEAVAGQKEGFKVRYSNPNNETNTNSNISPIVTNLLA